MFQIENPRLTRGLSAAGRINEYCKEFSSLSDEELAILLKEGKKSWKIWKGDPTWDVMNIGYQSDEAYKGVAAARILSKKYGEKHMKDLFWE